MTCRTCCFDHKPGIEIDEALMHVEFVVFSTNPDATVDVTFSVPS